MYSNGNKCDHYYHYHYPIEFYYSHSCVKNTTILCAIQLQEQFSVILVVIGISSEM